VTIIATVVVGFAGQGDASSVLARVGMLIGGLLLILLVARSRTIDRLLSKLIAATLRRFTKLELRDYVQLLDLANNYAVAELEVEADSWLAEHRLADLQLPAEGVLVLGIRRADGTFIGAPRGRTAVHEHDTLVVYGFADVLEDLGTRRVGLEGDRAHRAFVTEVAERQAEEDAIDTEA
jgi:Trk K+ transport system NAD-binding subunit